MDTCTKHTPHGPCHILTLEPLQLFTQAAMQLPNLLLISSHGLRAKLCPFLKFSFGCVDQFLVSLVLFVVISTSFLTGKGLTPTFKDAHPSNHRHLPLIFQRWIHAPNTHPWGHATLWTFEPLPFSHRQPCNYQT